MRALCALRDSERFSAASVTGGAGLGFDGEVHIDLDCAHTVLSADEAMRFAAELKKIADTIDLLPDKRQGEGRIEARAGQASNTALTTVQRNTTGPSTPDPQEQAMRTAARCPNGKKSRSKLYCRVGGRFGPTITEHSQD